jgi:hypothetical protein
MTSPSRTPLQFGLGGLFRVTVAVSLLLAAFTADIRVVAIATVVISVFTLLWVLSLFRKPSGPPPPTHS